MGTGSSMVISSSSNHIQKSSTMFWPMDVAYYFFKLKIINWYVIRKFIPTYMYYYTTYFGLRRWLGKILLIRFRWHVTHIWNSTWSQFNMIKSRIVNAAFTVLCITIKLIGSNSTRIILWLTRSNLWKNIFLNVFIKSILLNPVFLSFFKSM